MSLAQGKANKRYVAANREHYTKVMRENYYNKKEEYLDRTHKRTRTVTRGAQRWRNIVGPNYWDLKNKTDLI